MADVKFALPVVPVLSKSLSKPGVGGTGDAMVNAESNSRAARLYRTIYAALSPAHGGSSGPRGLPVPVLLAIITQYAIAPPQITTVAGSGVAGFLDHSDGARAQLDGLRECCLWRTRRHPVVAAAVRRTVPLAAATDDSGDADTAIDTNANQSTGDSEAEEFLLCTDVANRRLRCVSIRTQEVSTLCDGSGGLLEMVGALGVSIIPTDNSILVACADTHTIHRLVYPNGVITTMPGDAVDTKQLHAATDFHSSVIAGVTGECGYRDGDATSAQFDFPASVTPNSDGSFAIVADWASNRIRRLSPVLLSAPVDGIVSKRQVSTLAGNGEKVNTNGKLPLTRGVRRPFAVAWDTTTPAPDTVLYIATGVSLRVLNFPLDTITTIKTDVELSPAGLMFIERDSLLVSCGRFHSLFRVCVSTGKTERLAGGGGGTTPPGAATPNVSGPDYRYPYTTPAPVCIDGVDALSSTMYYPWGFALSEHDRCVYVCDSGFYRVRRVDLPDHILTRGATATTATATAVANPTAAAADGTSEDTNAPLAAPQWGYYNRRNRYSFDAADAAPAPAQAAAT